MGTADIGMFPEAAAKTAVRSVHPYPYSQTRLLNLPFCLDGSQEQTGAARRIPADVVSAYTTLRMGKETRNRRLFAGSSFKWYMGNCNIYNTRGLRNVHHKSHIPLST